MKSVILVYWAIFFGAAPQSSVPQPIDLPAVEASALPDLPELPFKEDKKGNVTISKEDFVRHLQAEIALKKAARAEVKGAREDVMGATLFVQEQNALRQAEIAQKEEEARKLQEVYAAMQHMHAQAKKIWDELQIARQAHQETVGQLQSAQYQIGAAHAEINRQRKLAWVPAPISTVIRLLQRDR